MVFKNVWKKRAMLCGRRKMASSQLQSETAAVHTLISDISHQVKTPAANIKIYTGMLEKRIEQADGRFYLDVLNKQADKLEFLMKTLVKMSRLETKLISLQIRDHKLLHILASALGTVVAAAKENRICRARGVGFGSCCPRERTAEERGGYELYFIPKCFPYL